MPRQCEWTEVVRFLFGAAESVNLIPALRPAGFQGVPVQWSRQNARKSKISFGDGHNIFINRDRVSLDVATSEAASVTSPGQ